MIHLPRQRRPFTREVISEREPTAPCEPTVALPGSPEKVAVLCQRAAKGQDLWHPDDPTIRYEAGGRGGIHQSRVEGWLASSGLNHNDPGFDNVIRALEEDR